MGVVESVSNFIQNNQLLLAGIGLSGAGLLTFWLKDFPKKIFYFLKREFTTDLVVTNHNKSFYEVLKWIAKKYKNKNFRTLKMTNGQWGYEDDTVTSIGYGLHWIFFKRRLFMTVLTKDPSNQSSYDKETITITSIGRSRKVIDEFIKEVSKVDEDVEKTKLFSMEDSWMYIREQTKRPLSSVFLEKEKKEMLLKTMDNFISRETWYVDNGIPYQLGILLYGSPGTGKTSLIKAIAGYLNYPIYYLSSQKLGKLESAMSNLPEKCIVVIEDIDSNSLTHSRESEPKTSVDGLLMKEFAAISLSEVLNSLDGLFSAHGRILIATTNHIEKLDAALIRPGRIDLKLEIGNVNTEILKEFLLHFFPNENIVIPNIIKDNITVAMLQNMVLEGKTLKEIINNVS